MKSHDCWCMAKKFGQALSPQEVKNTQKMTSLPLFWHTGSSLGRLQFWRGKWHPNWKFSLGLESRQAGFPTSTLGLNLDFRKCLKTTSKVARRMHLLARLRETQRPNHFRSARIRFVSVRFSPSKFVKAFSMIFWLGYCGLEAKTVESEYWLVGELNENCWWARSLSNICFLFIKGTYYLKAMLINWYFLFKRPKGRQTVTPENLRYIFVFLLVIKEIKCNAAPVTDGWLFITACND